MKDLVSIITPMFNSIKYIEHTIMSVQAQTYQNWEIIFWDNQSTDSSAKIFKSYNEKRFIYFYAMEHTSLYKARNLAIEKSNGDFISFLDVDDMWEKDKLELQMSYFDSLEVGVVFSNLWLVKRDLRKKNIHK